MDYLKPPKALQLSGNVATNWKSWRQAFELYMTASEADKKPENVKCALFLHVAGEAAVELYNTFQIPTEDIKLENLYDRFEKYCIPKRNVTFERHKFNMRNLGTSENIDQYVTELKILAKTCEFESLKESLIRDRIVCGITSDTVRERLLRDTELTLARAIEICRASKVSKEQLKKLAEEDRPSESILELKRYQKKNSKKDHKGWHEEKPKTEGSTARKDIRMAYKRSCQRCGGKHEYRRCPAFGAQCHKCGKNNHFATSCWAKALHEIEGESGSGSEDGEIERFATRIQTFHVGEMKSKEAKSQPDSWYVPMKIGKHEVRFKIDTGSQINTIPIGLADKLRDNQPYIPTNAKVMGYGGNVIPIRGKLNLRIGDKVGTEIAEFHVVNKENIEPILGLPTCQKLGIVYLMREMKKGGEVGDYETIIKEYEDVFTGLGTIDAPYDIQLLPDHSPTICKARRVPLTLMPKLKMELEAMTKNGVIEKVTEPTEWVNPIVLVEKPDGAVRICLDPTELNKAIRREHYPMSTIEEITGRMAGVKYWSTLDAYKGFWQIPLTEDSSYKTTFATPFGRYRFLKMPFGIKSAPEVFARSIKTILEDLDGVEDFYDDILIKGSTKLEHDTRLRKVLQRCKEKNLKLNRQKCKFGCTSVKYLGHIFTQEGLQIDPSKVEAIKKMPQPSNAKELERFLGMVNYVSRFTPQISQITKELRDLTVKETRWEWTERHQRSYEAIKKLITNAPILSYFDINKPITLQVDASKDGLGAVLLQEGKAVTYASKALTKSQTNFAQIEKEMLAIVFACERFHQYVYGKQITIESDHKPLATIIKKPMGETPPRLLRMIMRLQNYDLQITYKKGTELLVADTLSRAYINDKNDAEDQEEYRVHAVLEELSAEANSLADKMEERLPFSKAINEELTTATREDPQLQKLRVILQTGWPKEKKNCPKEIREYFPYQGEICEIKGLLFKGSRVIIPNKLRNGMFKILHAGHFGMERCKTFAREHIFWPGINRAIEDKIGNCEPCLHHRRTQSKETMVTTETPVLPWQTVSTDLFQFKEEMYLIVIDHYSKYFELTLLPNTKSETIVSYMKSHFARHGIPLKVISDNGPQYASMQFKAFATSWNFEHTTSSPRYPQSNGLVERIIQTVKNMLKKTLEEGQDPYLGLLNYRSTPLKDTASPAQLLMGRRLRTKLPESLQALRPKTEDPKQVARKWEERKEKYRHEYNKDAKDLPPLNRGDKAYLQQENSWTPVTVAKKRNEPRSYDVVDARGNVKRRNRRFLHRPRTVPMPETEIDEEEFPGEMRKDSSEQEAHTELPAADPPRIPAELQTQPVSEPRRTRSGRITRLPSRLKNFDLS